ncbi:type IV secretory system conjugative DNA transfer family protein [Thauera mechernichensis]|uniref:Type IV secretory system conjugative DNA transfer family protein n=1 Tax=Thauera mechernichensis TaxID=82788 RepID=A0ABW3WJ27_9RHOO|nr:type IV secretory system conjugative DNA transfer family protein [Thauera mechernichensis]MDG3066887.1 type IV secretory system conjugative DNA transfer family protein [Thauera mechernichensis]
MTLNISDNSWAKAGLAIGGLLLVVGLWAYLAGGIFMLAYDRKFEEATPLTLYQYWYHYGADAQVQKWLYIASGISLAVLLAPALLFFAPAKQSLFGDARFAKKSEITKAGLFGEKGIIVGKLGGRYLMFEGQQHAIISAPTRSGKGVGIVIPNLLNWPESVVVLDIKQENWDITSAYRRKYGQECYLFNPAATDYRTHRYNPLSYISEDPNFRIDDVQKIGNMLFPDQPGTDVIWTATPRSLFLGVCLYLLETPGKPVTLGQVLRETLVNGDGSAYFAKIINDRAAAGNPLSGACVRGLNTYISIAAENTRSGIIGGFRSRLELWMNPLVDAATSANDFDLRDVRKKRMSIYLGVTPDNLERMAPLLNLFFQQLIDLNTRELPNQNKAIKYTCMLLMDEFTAIGKIPILSKGISYIAGYWLRMMPIIQSPAQVVEVYGKDAAQTFTTNHALQIIYPPKASETQTARDISEWLGYQTVKGISVSKSKSIFGKKTPSESASDQRRALMLPQEITSLGKTRELVVMEDVPPILANKVLYFKDRAFVDRLKAVSARLHALGNKVPTKKQLDDAIEAGELGAPVPKIDLEAHEREMGGELPVTVVAPAQGGTEVVTVERPVTPDDVPNLAKLSLASFAVDFSAVEKPAVGELDEAALHAYADSLCQQAGIKL